MLLRVLVLKKLYHLQRIKALPGFKSVKVMGDLTQTLRETELKVSALLMHTGEHSEGANTKLFQKSNVHKDLPVGGTTAKAKFAAATARRFKQGEVTRADLPLDGWLGRTPRGQTPLGSRPS